MSNTKIALVIAVLAALLTSFGSVNQARVYNSHCVAEPGAPYDFNKAAMPESPPFGVIEISLGLVVLAILVTLARSLFLRRSLTIGFGLLASIAAIYALGTFQATECFTSSGDAEEYDLEPLLVIMAVAAICLLGYGALFVEMTLRFLKHFQTSHKQA